MLIIDIIKEHFRYRKQIYKLAIADYTKENINSLLGWFWNIIKPSIMIFVYWFAFAIGLRVGKDISEYPFFLWLLVGIIPWFYISDMLRDGSNSLRKNSYLVTKMKFPVEVIPTFTNISNLFTHLILIGIVVIIFLLMGYPITIYIIQLPIYILLTFLFLNLWSFATSFIVVFSKDIYNLIKAFITPLFWLSGIIWNISNVDIGWLNILLRLNPITYLVTGYRNCFLEKTWFYEQPMENLIFLCIIIFMGILGVIIYKKLRKEIADVL